jgi:hypothetical protein
MLLIASTFCVTMGKRKRNNYCSKCNIQGHNKAQCPNAGSVNNNKTQHISTKLQYCSSAYYAAQEETLLTPSLSLALTIKDKPCLWLEIYGAGICERVLSTKRAQESARRGAGLCFNCYSVLTGVATGAANPLPNVTKDDRYGKNAQFGSDHQYNHYKSLLDVRLTAHQACNRASGCPCVAVSSNLVK